MLSQKEKSMTKDDIALIDSLRKTGKSGSQAIKRILVLLRDVERQTILQNNAYRAGLRAGYACEEPDELEYLLKMVPDESKRLVQIREEEKHDVKIANM
jgi:predicted hydrocarbon binding protein